MRIAENAQFVAAREAELRHDGDDGWVSRSSSRCTPSSGRRTCTPPTLRGFEVPRGRRTLCDGR